MNRRNVTYFLMTMMILIGYFSFLHLKFEPSYSAYGFASKGEIENLKQFENQFPKSKEGRSAIVILSKKSGWKTYTDFQKLVTLSTSVNRLDEVEEIFSVTNLSFPKKGPFGMQQIDLLRLDSEENFQKSYAKLQKMDYAHSKFLAKNGEYALFFLNLKKDLSSASIQKLEEIQGKENATYVYYSGYVQDENESEMISETILIAALAILFVILSFYFFARSFRGLLVIALTLLFNLSLVFSFMFLTDIPFSMNMVGVPSLIIILSFSDLMHIFYHQSILADQAKDDVELRRTILRKIGLPMILTSLTNGLGFIVFFLISDVQVMTELAIVSLFGILAAYLSSRFLILPTMTKGKRFIARNNLETDGKWYFIRIHQLVKKRRLVTFATSAVFILCLLAVIFQFKIDFKTENYVQTNTKSFVTSSILAEHFFGSHTGQIAIKQSNHEEKWSKFYQSKLELVEQVVDSIFEPLAMTSTNSLVKRFHQVQIGGNPAGYRLMDNLSAETIEPHIEDLGGKNLISKNGLMSKLEFGFKDNGLDENLAKFKVLETNLKKLSDEKTKFELTGSAFISDQSVVRYTQKVLFGLAIGLILTCLLVLFYFKSLRLSIGTLLVNAIPIFICISIMMLTDVQINPQSLFLLSALMGLCLDDSLYLMSYRTKRISDLNLYPIRVTSVVLALTFGALLISSFTWLKEFAVIFIVGIFLAFILDVLIYPVFMNLSTNEND